MVEKGCGFNQTGDGVELRHVTVRETADLRKNKPHPVAPLAAGAQFRTGDLVAIFLGFDEPFEVETVVIHLTCPSASERSCGLLHEGEHSSDHSRVNTRRRALVFSEDNDRY